MLTKVTFKNLRCFKDFTLDGLAPLTLISGRNNAGKTTLLEGILILAAYKSPELFFKINNIRDIPAITPSPQGFILGLEPLALWETLFSDMDMALKLLISTESNDGSIDSVCLEKDMEYSLTQFSSSRPQPLGQQFYPTGMTQPQQGLLQPVPGTYILKVSYDHNDNHEFGRFALTQNGLALQLAPTQLPRNLPFTMYIGPNTPSSQHPVSDWFGAVEIKAQKESIIKALQLLDNGITDVFSVPRHGIVELYARWSTGNPRPLRILGDGINKLLSYLLAMIANPGGMFLLDEIETGFHYSFYPKLWKLVADVAEKTGSQVIATTHSYECISAAAEGAATINPSLLTYVRLEKEDNAIVPYVFPADDLAFALKSEMEVR
jgi:ABC-type branched-subunit amino acid transport system ATPase component